MSISPTAYGLAKDAAFNVVTKMSANDCFQWKNRNEEFKEFTKQLIGYMGNFNVQYRTFHTYFPQVLGSFKSL